MATDQIILTTKDGFKYFLVTCGTLTMTGFIYLLYQLYLVFEFAGLPGTILAVYYISGLIISFSFIVYALNHRIIFDKEGIMKIGFTGSRKYIPYKDLQYIRISNKLQPFLAARHMKKSKNSLFIDYRYENSDEVHQYLLSMDFEHLILHDEQKLEPDPTGS
jgi:hypothetical protein